MNRLIKLVGCVLSVFILIGVSQGRCNAAVDAPKQQSQDYLIGAEDLLEVSVWKNPDLSREVRVRPDGMISLPLVGDIKASGLTPDDLRKSVVERIKEYQENAVVSIIVRDINSYKIYILGEVARPGTYTLKAKTTLVQALAIAGGFTQFASKNDIVLIREKNDGSGKSEKIRLRFKDVVKDGGPDKNPVLIAGDTVFVP